MRWPHINREFFGREEIRAAATQGQAFDRYLRTPEGWKFAERVYEVRYVDETPLTGQAPNAAGREC